MSLAELLVIFTVAALVFGPEKLPALAKQLGRMAAKAHRLKEHVGQYIENEKQHLKLEENIRRAEQVESKTPAE